IMDSIWNRFDTFSHFYQEQSEALETKIGQNYQNTRRVMEDQHQDLPHKISYWREQAQVRAQMRSQYLETINARADADHTQSRAEIDILLRQLAAPPQRQ
ncbi:MAG TPA: hypothetical protein VJH22_04020, partial [Candidatus Nanoarchaeia archaeon]|nr:hypothetical protein [Candidatus Nanoarchaeia archaeon]